MCNYEKSERDLENLDYIIKFQLSTETLLLKVSNGAKIVFIIKSHPINMYNDQIKSMYTNKGLNLDSAIHAWMVCHIILYIGHA